MSSSQMNKKGSEENQYINDSKSEASVGESVASGTQINASAAANADIQQPHKLSLDDYYELVVQAQALELEEDPTSQTPFAWPDDSASSSDGDESSSTSDDDETAAEDSIVETTDIDHKTKDANEGSLSSQMLSLSSKSISDRLCAQLIKHLAAQGHVLQDAAGQTRLADASSPPQPVVQLKQALCAALQFIQQFNDCSQMAAAVEAERGVQSVRRALCDVRAVEPQLFADAASQLHVPQLIIDSLDAHKQLARVSVTDNDVFRMLNVQPGFVAAVAEQCDDLRSWARQTHSATPDTPFDRHSLTAIRQAAAPAQLQPQVVNTFIAVLSAVNTQLSEQGPLRRHFYAVFKDLFDELSLAHKVEQLAECYRLVPLDELVAHKHIDAGTKDKKFSVGLSEVCAALMSSSNAEVAQVATLCDRLCWYVMMSPKYAALKLLSVCLDQPQCTSTFVRCIRLLPPFLQLQLVDAPLSVLQYTVESLFHRQVHEHINDESKVDRFEQMLFALCRSKTKKTVDGAEPEIERAALDANSVVLSLVLPQLTDTAESSGSGRALALRLLHRLCTHQSVQLRYVCSLGGPFDDPERKADSGSSVNVPRLCALLHTAYMHCQKQQTDDCDYATLPHVSSMQQALLSTVKGVCARVGREGRQLDAPAADWLVRLLNDGPWTLNYAFVTHLTAVLPLACKRTLPMCVVSSLNTSVQSDFNKHPCSRSQPHHSPMQCVLKSLFELTCLDEQLGQQLLQDLVELPDQRREEQWTQLGTVLRQVLVRQAAPNWQRCERTLKLLFDKFDVPNQRAITFIVQASKVAYAAMEESKPVLVIGDSVLAHLLLVKQHQQSAWLGQPSVRHCVDAYCQLAKKHADNACINMDNPGKAVLGQDQPTYASTTLTQLYFHACSIANVWKGDSETGNAKPLSVLQLLLRSLAQQHERVSSHMMRLAGSAAQESQPKGTGKQHTYDTLLSGMPDTAPNQMNMLGFGTMPVDQPRPEQYVPIAMPPIVMPHQQAGYGRRGRYQWQQGRYAGSSSNSTSPDNNAGRRSSASPDERANRLWIRRNRLTNMSDRELQNWDRDRALWSGVAAAALDEQTAQLVQPSAVSAVGSYASAAAKNTVPTA